MEKFSRDISELLLPDCEQWAYLTGKASGTVRQCSQVQRPVMICTDAESSRLSCINPRICRVSEVRTVHRSGYFGQNDTRFICI